MSGFVVVYERDDTGNDVRFFDEGMKRLKHRGPDGSDVLRLKNISMGHWRFWTTPEEVGECQPLAMDGLWIVFDGRIDNRDEVFGDLEIDVSCSEKISDAKLILQAYHRWGQDCFLPLVGEFALVIFDEERNQVVCARDHLGERTMFYRIEPSKFVVASEPWAVLGAFGAKPELNDDVVAGYFSSKSSDDGQTFFKHVYELLPAHVMTVDRLSHEKIRYWKPDKKKIRYLTDGEYAKEFLVLLKESVRCRLRSTTPVGVLMSGGLDSTSIACLAAQMLAPEALITISNVYNELSDCDERVYIDAVKEKWNLRSIQVPSDDTWTFKNWKRVTQNPNKPESMLYRASMERDCKIARDEGLRVLFMGEAGDTLYLAGSEWLLDFIKDGRFGDALRGLILQIRTKGLRYPFRANHIWPLIRTFLKKFFPRILNLRHNKITYPIWLTNFAVQRLRQGQLWVDPELERYGTMLGLRLAEHCSHEKMNANYHQIELRYPYRDRRLVEYMASIPAYLLHYGGLYKHILRIAMNGILPEIVRVRPRPTYLTSLFFRGFERETQILEDYLYNTDEPAWNRFVEPKWLLKRLSRKPVFQNFFIAWLCVAYETWYISTFTIK